MPTTPSLDAAEWMKKTSALIGSDHSAAMDAVCIGLKDPELQSSAIELAAILADGLMEEGLDGEAVAALFDVGNNSDLDSMREFLPRYAELVEGEVPLLA